MALASRALPQLSSPHLVALPGGRAAHGHQVHLLDRADGGRVRALDEPLQPATLAVAAQQLEADHDAALAQWRLAVERVRYEAERAERRYRAVEPENRLVARGLEAEWERRLRELLVPRDASDGKDVILEVKAGEGGEESALFAGDLLRMYTRYAEARGWKVEMLDANESDLGGYKSVTVAVKAKGTIFAFANPEAAVRVVYEVYPHTKPTGKDEATAIRDDVKVLNARIVNWKLEKAAVKRWGENSEANYAAYTDFVLKWGIIKEKIDWRDLITNELFLDGSARLNLATFVTTSMPRRAAAQIRPVEADPIHRSKLVQQIIKAYEAHGIGRKDFKVKRYLD